MRYDYFSIFGILGRILKKHKNFGQYWLKNKNLKSIEFYVMDIKKKSY